MRILSGRLFDGLTLDNDGVVRGITYDTGRRRLLLDDRLSVPTEMTLAAKYADTSDPGTRWTPAGYRLAWSDEFAQGDTAVWASASPEDAPAYPQLLPPWRTIDGNMIRFHLTDDAGGPPYPGRVRNAGAISSKNGFEYRYGYLETRFRANQSYGGWPSIWMQSDPANPDASARETLELDLMEGDGQGSQATTMHKWCNGYDGLNTLGATDRDHAYITSPSQLIDNMWSVLGLLWTRDLMICYLNGHEYRRFTRSDMPKPVGDTTGDTCWDDPRYLILDYVVHSDAPGVNKTALIDPAHDLLVDYIRIYQDPTDSESGIWLDYKRQ
ncbi:glucan endo-1,3-beta-D-glucosidase [Bifidobacterium callitrichos DSM 23973]|uniref:Glucan endo-1,3-beta-D-glucosidase n=1 Tax=Bifidobacterium callitrichos DSM 23973 TaxID=1437609 RepID=A0A087ACU2_9BIFI|nr:glucan endo-1,3-beta-D-glucosidase [Bifidobacterium callitrichos DSM 23973]